jgi:parvulin-like peptidyl-prolyl isomerase
MHKIFLTSFFLLFLISCTSKDEGIKLDKDSEEYNFAKELSIKFPQLNPDLNKTLINTKKFNITTGNVFEALFRNFPGELDKLKDIDSTRLKKIFNENAYLLAEKKLIINAAIDNSFEVSDTELDSILQIQYKKAGGKNNFENYMKNKNIDIDYIVEDYKNSLLIQKFLKNSVKDSISVSEDEIQDKMMQIASVTVRHILLKTNGINESEKIQKRNKLEKVLKRAQKGESFSKLAQTFSEDASTAANGGLIKNIKPGETLEPFNKIAFSLDIGEISDIFETQFGYHILTIVDRKKEDRSPKEIKEEIFEAKQRKILPKIINKLKKQYEFTESKI